MTVTDPNSASPGLSQTALSKLDDFLHDAVASGRNPAIHLGAIGVQGPPIYFACRGDRVFGEPTKGPVDEETWLQMYSMTKLVTAVAILQLVEVGKVELDSPSFLERVCPDLAGLPVLDSITDGEPKLLPRQTDLTVRHLLTHTSGLAYLFTSPMLDEYCKVTGSVGHWANTVEGYSLPLVFQPGTHWKYSVGLDWSGIIVERVSGLRLSEYMSRYIFRPLGVDDGFSFFPTEHVTAHLQECCTRTSDGALVHCASPKKMDLRHVEASQLGGGGGLYGTAPAYLRFLQGILASQEPGGILSPASFRLLFTDALPARGCDSAVRADFAELAGGLGFLDAEHVANEGQGLGHSVGLLLTLDDSKYGRKAGSGMWGGMAKTQYWLDPSTGIAGICFTQLLVNKPDPFTEVYNNYQKLLYSLLER